MVNYKLCAFADEADKALVGQIRAMQENGIEYLEMRGVNGINVAKLTAAEAKSAAAELKAGGIKVWSLGSPAGKTPITDPFDFEQEQFKRLLETADITGAKCIRLFSFYGTDGKAEYRDEVMERLSRFVELAKGSGVMLCHENEKGIYGDNAARCLEIHQLVPELKGVFDPANFVQCGIDTQKAWHTLSPYVEYVHVKDAKRDGTVTLAGDSEGNVRSLLAQYAAMGGEVVTLEPHLKKFIGLDRLENGVSLKHEGFYKTGDEAFDAAARRLKEILASI